MDIDRCHEYINRCREYMIRNQIMSLTFSKTLEFDMIQTKLSEHDLLY